MALDPDTPPMGEIEAFRRANRVRRLAVFGSALRDDFGPESDVDLLVGFEPGAAPGLGFFAMQSELSQPFRTTVELNTPGFLSPRFRGEVVAGARDLSIAA